MIRFDPFSDFEAMTRSLFGDPSGSTRIPRFMPMDLYRVGDHYVLNADLPGIDPGSVDVNVENGVLTLTAHRSAQSEENVQWLASERFSGTFRRQVSLGDGVDADGISASYENGVLSVMIPVAERARPRRIEISHKDHPKVIESESSKGRSK